MASFWTVTLALAEGLPEAVGEAARAPGGQTERLNALLTERTRELERVTAVLDSLYVDWRGGEIDGERYDRNFIAHTPDEVMGAARRWFSYCRELASERPIWRQLLFRREGGCP